MIEDILNEFVEDKANGIIAVLVLKANEGYSVVPIYAAEYRDYFMLERHWNGPTVLEAIEDMRRDMKGE